MYMFRILALEFQKNICHLSITVSSATRNNLREFMEQGLAFTFVIKL